jgi:2-(3-amino-3-carboxypropyl)histidine synthase
MIHYGHSCLVPVDITTIKTMYVFVDIGIDMDHFIQTVKLNVEKKTRIAMVATIQFVASLHLAVQELHEYTLYVPQSRPLSKGEILGCTAPKLHNQDLLIYLGDGRFHLEAIMIANPGLEAYRYDPYSKTLTREVYQHEEMQELRTEAIEQAASATCFGLIQGTLGRQGAPNVVHYLEQTMIEKQIPFIKVFMSEITPQKLSLFSGIDVWIQVACPRLSIDWGYAFPKPLLTPYEAAVVFGKTKKWNADGDGIYPMDFYARESLGPWTPNHQPPKQ